MKTESSRFLRPRFLLSIAASLAALFAPLQDASAGAPDEIRAIWAQAWVSDLHTPEAIDNLIANTKAANFNTLIVQMRRRADTLYFSDIDPRASDVQPGFDALEYILEKARAQNPPMEVHAWIVVYPVDSNTTNPEHVKNKHPEWLTRTAGGAVDETLDPGHPGVHQYLLDVSMELVTKYDIDGLHYDYIRYNGNQWGYNPVALERFQKLYDRNDTPSSTDAEWSEFRRDQITQTVRRIYLYAMEAQPEVKISASTITWGDTGVRTLEQWPSSSAYAAVLQDWRGWMEEGILDLNVPMNYYREHNTTPPEDHAQAYRNWSTFAKNHKYDRHLAIGPGIYLNTLSNAITQMRHTREPTESGNHADGVAGYTYHETNNEGLPFSEFRKALTQPSLYDPVSPPMFAEPAAIPEMPWKTDPTTGHLKGYVLETQSGEPLDGAMVQISGDVERTIQTDPTGFYGFVDLPPGDYAVTFTWDGDAAPSTDAAISVGEVTHQDLDYVAPPPTTGQLEGYVRNATTDIPVNNATVYVSGESNQITQTDAQGFYEFSDLPPGDYTVSASWNQSDEDAPATMLSFPWANSSGRICTSRSKREKAAKKSSWTTTMTASSISTTTTRAGS